MQKLLIIGTYGSGALSMTRLMANRPWHRNNTVVTADTAVRFEASLLARMAGLNPSDELLEVRPYRAPHHTVSEAGLIGRFFDKRTRPGEISLAHGGILVLDHVNLFSQSVLDVAFAAMDEGVIRLRNRLETIVIPCRPEFVIATATPNFSSKAVSNFFGLPDYEAELLSKNTVAAMANDDCEGREAPGN